MSFYTQGQHLNHPSSNGEGEHLVETFKHDMKYKRATPLDVICKQVNFCCPTERLNMAPLVRHLHKC